MIVQNPKAKNAESLRPTFLRPDVDYGAEAKRAGLYGEVIEAKLEHDIREWMDDHIGTVWCRAPRSERSMVWMLLKLLDAARVERNVSATTIANLQSALVAAGHTPDCPVVHDASVDCVTIGECIDWKARAEAADAECERLRMSRAEVLHDKDRAEMFLDQHRRNRERAFMWLREVLPDMETDPGWTIHDAAWMAAEEIRRLRAEVANVTTLLQGAVPIMHDAADALRGAADALHAEDV